MKILERIGVTISIIGLAISIWFAASFIDIATKNHVSDKNYKQYSDWNLIIILNDFAERG